MSAEENRKVRSSLNNPRVKLNISNGTIDIVGSYSVSNGTSTKTDKIYKQSIPFKKAIQIDTIPLEWVDPSGQVHRELVSVDNAFDYMRKNATTNNPSTLAKIEALYQSVGQSVSGVISGGININNRTYGGGDTIASILGD